MKELIRRNFPSSFFSFFEKYVLYWNQNNGCMQMRYVFALAILCDMPLIHKHMELRQHKIYFSICTCTIYMYILRKAAPVASMRSNDSINLFLFFTMIHSTWSQVNVEAKKKKNSDWHSIKFFKLKLTDLVVSS